MTDNHSKEVRSYNMSRIGSKDTKPEVLVRKYLFSKGFRYRKNDKRFPGKPDIILPKYKTAIFINGCFWHKHEGCRCFVWPKSNVEYWKQKIERNVKRDEENYKKLKDLGWKTVVVWECELNKNIINERLARLEDEIKKEEV